jgi:hypothetical protein
VNGDVQANAEPAGEVNNNMTLAEQFLAYVETIDEAKNQEEGTI